MSLSFSMRLTVPADVLVRELDGESVVLSVERECYFGLDEVGTRMWAVLTASDSIQKAYDQLLSEYDVAPEVLRRDLQEFVEELVEDGLVELQAGPAEREGDG
jgi:hypothetical protein